MWPCALPVLVALAGAVSAQEPAVTVSAAISLSEAFEELAKAYAKDGGGAVRFNFAGSNVLARQIVNGAPVDVFVSADEAQMAVVEKAGVVRAGGAVAIVSNQLVVAALPDRVDAIRAGFPSASPEIKRLAIGDPAAVPAGVYAAAYLRSRGLWAAYESRIVPTTNVRAALAAVESGGVDAAIVYATDVRQSTRARVAIAIPPDQAPRIVYPAAVIEGAKNRQAAERFLAFLQSQTARQVNTTSTPSCARKDPNGPRGENSINRIRPVATGGITNGSDTNVSSSTRPRNRRRPSSQARKTPGTSISAVAAAAVAMVNAVMLAMFIRPNGVGRRRPAGIRVVTTRHAPSDSVGRRGIVRRPGGSSLPR